MEQFAFSVLASRRLLPITSFVNLASVGAVKASWTLLEMRPRADTVYSFCRAQSRTRLHRIPPCHRRLDNPPGSAGLLRRDSGAVVYVSGQLSPVVGMRSPR